jgi:hypothetical protein
MPSVPPHREIDLSTREQNQLLSKCGPAYFARYVTKWDLPEHTEFWYVIKDEPEALENYKSKIRNQIKRGLKSTVVRQVSRETLVAEGGYEVYVKAFGRYGDQKPLMDRGQFDRHIVESEYEYWAVFTPDGVMIAYAQNWIADNTCSYGNMKFDPDYLNFYGSYALIYTMNRHYLNERKMRYVSDGARSIYHETNIQEFLMQKFRFRKAYCRLSIVYRWDIQLLVKVLYPFRKIFHKFNDRYSRKINVLLTNEWIARVS